MKERYILGEQINFGELGLSDTANRNVPQKVEIPINEDDNSFIKDTVIKIFANHNLSYIITQSGKVFVCGEGYGITPVYIELDHDVVDISSSYALAIDGTVYDLQTWNSLQISEGIKYISEGTSHTVFLSENNTVYAVRK